MLNRQFAQKVMHAAQELAPEIIRNRRVIHGYAELGMELPQTVAFVMEQLRGYGCDPKPCGMSGVVATVGKPGKTFLLRADMDALPMPEESGLDFAAANGNNHACGHDCHPAMLLGAARLLKQYEGQLKGTVKLMFQPGEEIGKGALDMLEDGLMENPRVDAALGLHVGVAFPWAKTGNVQCIVGPYGHFVGGTDITVHGQSAHGAASHRGVDALTIASFINMGLQTVLAREVPSSNDDILLVGTLNGGTTSNSVAGEAKLGVTMRALTQETYAFLEKRTEEIATSIAKAFRGSVSFEKIHSSPAPFNEPTHTRELADYCREILPEEKVIMSHKPFGAGDDFAFISYEVPSAMLNVGFGSSDEGYTVGGHNPKVVYNEDALPVGAALHTWLAMRWLDEHSV